MSNRYRELLRRKLLSDMYSRMSDDERHALLQSTMTDSSHQEVMSALNGQSAELDYISRLLKRKNWWFDFANNVSANFLTDGLILLGSKLLKRR